jgi:hypothetical protein
MGLPAGVPLAEAAEALLPLRRQALQEGRLLDTRRCMLACVFYPQGRTLAADEDDVLPASTAACYQAGTAPAFDPAFLLPMAAANLSTGCLDLPTFLAAGLLPLCLRSLASPDHSLRALAYEVLGLASAALAQAQLREKAVLELLLAHVKNAVAKPFQQLPAISATLAAEASLVLCHPESPLFRPVHRTVLATPALALAEVPLARKLLTPGSRTAAAEQVWMLRLLWVGLRGSKDAALYQRRHVLELAMAGYRSQSSSRQGDRLVLHLLRQAATLPGLAAKLVQGSGLAEWLKGVAARGGAGGAGGEAVQAVQARGGGAQDRLLAEETLQLLCDMGLSRSSKVAVEGSTEEQQAAVDSLVRVLGC